MNKTVIFIISFLVGNIVMLLGFILYDGNFNITDHQSNIYSGVLGLFGGVIGAMGAFFIAKMQLNLQIKEQEKAEVRNREEQKEIINRQFTNQLKIMESQLERQFIKDKEKMKLEIEINKIQDAIKEISNIKTLLISLYPTVEGLSKYEKLSGSEKLNNDAVLTSYIKEYKGIIEIITQRINDYIIYKFLYEDITLFTKFHTEKIIKPFNECNGIVKVIAKERYNSIENNRTKTVDELLKKMNRACEDELNKFNDEINDKLK